MKDYYAMLSISEHSTPDQIKIAWREAAKKLHPDRGGDPAVFSELSEAYDVLSNPNKKAAYDLAFRAISSLRCQCGRAKLPGADLCTWCALSVAQDIDKREARQRKVAREQRMDRIKSWLKGSSSGAPSAGSKQAEAPPPPPPSPRSAPNSGSPSSPSGGEASESRTSGRSRAKPKVPRVEPPSPDQILDSILADVAVASGIRDAGIDVRLQLDPKTGKLKLSGNSVDALRSIHENVVIATEMIDAAQRFISK
jgi:curved DNA-binding protein CbpA